MNMVIFTLKSLVIARLFINAYFYKNESKPLFKSLFLRVGKEF